MADRRSLVAGTLRIPDAFDTELGPGLRKLRDDISAIAGEEIPVALAACALSMWAWLHGLVSLEVFGQFKWIYPETAEPLFEAALRAQLASVGLEPTRAVTA